MMRSVRCSGGQIEVANEQQWLTRANDSLEALRFMHKWARGAQERLVSKNKIS